MSFAGELQIDLVWASMQTLLSEQLGPDVNVDCIGERDFDEDGDITIIPPAARILFVEESAGEPFDSQNATYCAEQAFAVLCAAQDLSGVQDQRRATLELVAQVKHILCGARLRLDDGAAVPQETEPIIWAGTSSLGTAELGVIYAPKFIVPGIAQFSAPNASLANQEAQ